jgi:hypothetical protein
MAPWAGATRPAAVVKGAVSATPVGGGRAGIRRSPDPRTSAPRPDCESDDPVVQLLFQSTPPSSSRARACARRLADRGAGVPGGDFGLHHPGEHGQQEHPVELGAEQAAEVFRLGSGAVGLLAGGGPLALRLAVGRAGAQERLDRPRDQRLLAQVRLDPRHLVVDPAVEGVLGVQALQDRVAAQHVGQRLVVDTRIIEVGHLHHEEERAVAAGILRTGAAGLDHRRRVRHAVLLQVVVGILGGDHLVDGRGEGHGIADLRLAQVQRQPRTTLAVRGRVRTAARTGGENVVVTHRRAGIVAGEEQVRA